MRDNIRKERAERVPLGDRNKLAVAGLNDVSEYEYRWVNDVGDRVQRLYDAGYDFVDSVGKVIADATADSARSNGAVLSKSVGQGVKAYLMKQPKEIWLEDRKRRVDDPTNDTEAGMANKANGFYGQVSVGQKK